MSGSDSGLREELSQFGFSDKEIDVYLALLRDGESTATVLASSADVSKRFIYDVMDRFEQRGFVHVNAYETPTTIEPVPPGDVVNQLNDRLSSLEEGLDAEYRKPERTRHRTFETIKTERTFVRRLSQLIDVAEGELLVSAPLQYLTRVEDQLRTATRSGVFTVVLVHEIPDQKTLPDVKGWGHVVRAWDSTTATIVMADTDHGLYLPPRDVRTRVGFNSIAYENGYFSPLLYPTFWSGKWRNANEVHLEPPLDLPHRYERFTHAVFDALMYHRRGKTLTAELSVRPAQTDEDFERVRGEIVEIKHGFVKPESGTIPIQQSLVINADGNVFTVSALGAFIEDYETKYVRLLDQAD